jgi:hypothetical protein
MATIRRVGSSKYWQAQIRVDGRWVTRSTKCEDEVGAQRVADEMEAAVVGVESGATKEQVVAGSSAESSPGPLLEANAHGLENLTEVPKGETKVGEVDWRGNLGWAVEGEKWVVRIASWPRETVDVVHLKIVGQLEGERGKWASQMRSWLAEWFKENRRRLWEYPMLDVQGWSRRLGFEMRKLQGKKLSPSPLLDDEPMIF